VLVLSCFFWFLACFGASCRWGFRSSRC
jgi:hypothetical protein